MNIALIVIASIFTPVILIIGWLVYKTASTAKRVEKYLPPLGQHMDVNGERIHYLDRGEGPPIVMIHGLSGQMRHFTFALQERLDNNFRTIIVDRPGCGYSERKSDDAARVTEQAKSISELIKKLELDRPLLVGHSLGAAVSLALALNHPECVGGLALIAPLTHPPKEDAQIPPAFRAYAVRSPLVRNIIAWTLATPGAIKYREIAMNNVFGPDIVPDDVATKGGGMLVLRPKNFYTSSTDFLSAPIDLPEMLERYNTISVPTGIIYGTEDRILNYQEHGVPMKGRINGLDLELIEGAGHMILMTKPDQVAAFIRRTAARVWTSNVQAVN